METKVTRNSKWNCSQCCESKEILTLLNNQKAELSKLVELTSKVDKLTKDLSTFKKAVPDMIKNEIISVLNNDPLVKNNIDEAIKNKIDSALPTLNQNSNDISRCRNIISQNSLKETRKDILISGFPPSIKSSFEIANLVIKACAILTVDLSLNDIYQCYWLNDKKNILVKFNSLLIRDLIMD